MAGVIGLAGLKRCWNNNLIRYDNISFPKAKLTTGEDREITQHHKTDHLMVSITHQVICFYTNVGFI